MRGRMLGVAVAAAAVAMSGPGLADDEAGDLRNLAVGTHLSDLPTRGYTEFACAGDELASESEIDGWADFAACPRNEDGRHVVAFRFDDSEVLYDEFKGTKVGGHPVRVAAVFDPDGTLWGLQVMTDPSASAFHARKAFLFRLGVKARYGDEGWTCADNEPGPGQSMIGNVFVKEHCRKTVDGKVIRYESNFYRAGSGREAPIVNSSWFEIRQDESS